jgi:hypothetical protein
MIKKKPHICGAISYFFLALASRLSSAFSPFLPSLASCFLDMALIFLTFATSILRSSSWDLGLRCFLSIFSNLAFSSLSKPLVVLASCFLSDAFVYFITCPSCGLGLPSLLYLWHQTSCQTSCWQRPRSSCRVYPLAYHSHR